MALAAIGSAAVVEGLRVVRIKPDRFIEILNAAIVLAFVVVRKTAVVKQIRVLRIDLDRLVQIFDGAVLLAFAVIGVSAAAECCRVGRIKLDRLAASSIALSFSFFSGNSAQRFVKSTES